MQAFAAPVALRPFLASAPLKSATTPLHASPALALASVRMVSDTILSNADAYMSRTIRSTYKSAAAPMGTYTVQCAEGTVPFSGYDLAVRARNAAFKKRQASPSEMYRDLYATRRAAIVGAHNCSVEEAKFVAYPAAAAAYVFGKAEALRACNRYASDVGIVDGYMAKVVTNQYKAMKVPNGVYGTACCDGGSAGEADDARIAALAVAFKAGQFLPGAKAQAKYNASSEAIALSRGCDYEEVQFMKYPTGAGSMRWSSGAYGAVKLGAAAGVSGGGGAKALPLALRISDNAINSATLWPSKFVRPAITKKSPFWVASTLKQYGGFSPAAAKYGVEAQTAPFRGGNISELWTTGWQPTPVSVKQYGTV